MEQQVLSIEQMKHLKELGVDTSKASMVWGGTKDWQELYTHRLLELDVDADYIIEAFTLQDMLEMISGCFNHEYEFKFMYYLDTWYAKYMPMIDDDDYFISSNRNPLICAYEALCWCAGNNHIGGEK